MQEASTFVPRLVCPKCRRPARVCYCAHVTPIATRTRVIFLQHPRERDVPINTARIANLCLPNSELLVGVRWETSAQVLRELSDASRPAALLYPGEGAIDVMREPPRGPITLFVVDGTWWQTKKLVRENPLLRALPRYAFTPPEPSEYRIRREPKDDYVSTIEALAHVLGAIEGEPERFRSLYAPFRAMVETQLVFKTEVRASRHRRNEPAKPRSPRVSGIFRDRAEDLVCVVAEANAWPYRSKERDSDAYPDELVHWVARRMTTGETLDVVVRPRSVLAPSTPRHIHVSAGELAEGTSVDELFSRWRAFVRPNDVICSWGRYGTSLFVATGGELPEMRVDVRDVARNYARRPVGTMDDFLGVLGAEATPAMGQGRAGVRVAQLASIVGALAERAR